MQNDRRAFLKNVGGITAAVVASTTLTREAVADSGPDAASAAGTLQRPPGRVQIGLFLDGEKGEQSFAGWLTSVEGGSSEADVVTEIVGPDSPVAKKHIAGVKYEDITVSCGASMSKAFYDWIKASFDGKPTRRDGSIVAADFNGSVVDTLAFKQALISEIAFPALDAASKDAAKMTIKLAPGATAFDLGDGAKVNLPTTPRTNWPVSNFKVEIDGMDAATTRVSKIDAIVIKQTFFTSENPGTLEVPGPLEVPNLVVTFPETTASEFVKWHEDFIVKNNSDSPDALEKMGSLSFVSSNLKDEYFKLSFSNLGPSKVTPPVGGSSDTIRRVKAEMYCETIKFDYKASWG